MIKRKDTSIKDSWITVNSGAKFFFNDIRKSCIQIHDIAHALSGQGRFCGQADRKNGRVYSIAEHCINVSKFVPVEHAFTALMHDAAEAYLTDLTTPLKNLCPDFKKIEAETDAFIAEVFGYIYPFHSSVKQADWNMFLTEYDVMFQNKIEGEFDRPPYKGMVEFYNWEPDVAYHMFLARFNELTGRCK